MKAMRKASPSLLVLPKQPDKARGFGENKGFHSMPSHFPQSLIHSSWRHHMHFMGLQKMTLLDYPGKVACTVFLSGCNFRCPFCHNPDLVFASEPGTGTQYPLLVWQSQPCRPCNQNTCARKDHACLENLPPQRVAGRMLEILRHQDSG